MAKIVMRVDKYVDRLAPLITPYITDALSHAYGETTSEAVLDEIRNSRAQLWTISDSATKRLEAVCVTAVVTYHSIGVLRIIVLAGKGMQQWVRPLDDALQDFARQRGLQRMEAAGRKGLKKILGELAFIPAYTVYIKEVEDGKDGRENRNNLQDECPNFSATVC